MGTFQSKWIDYKLNSQGRAKSFLDFLEFCGILISFPLSIFTVKAFFIPSWDIKLGPVAFFFVFLIISWYVLSRITAMAKVPRTQRYRTVIFQFIRVNFIILLFLLLIKVIFRFTSIPLIFIFTYVSFSLIITLSIRIIAYHFLKIYRSNGYNLHHVLIIADAFSDSMIEKLMNQTEWGFVVSGIVTDSKLIRYKYGSQVPIFSQISQIKNIIDSRVIDEVIYSKHEIDEELIRETSDICNEIGVIFRIQSTVSPLDPMQIQLQTMNRSGYLTLVDTPSNKFSYLLKIISDIYFSITALLLLSPLLVLIAILIKVDSRGPVFFRQERIGLRGRKFQLYKFRSMVDNAEHKLQEIRNKNQADGPVFKIKRDPRITRVGLILRKTGIDELPQLYNVIRGEMSLIGPRPPLESEVKSYERWQLRRLSVRPGITCTWQVIPNRNDVKFEKWMKMDLNYIDNWSLAKDFRLIFQTIKTMFLANGH